METDADVTPKRPGVVSFIGAILYVQSFLAAVAAISLLLWRNDILDFLEREESPMSGGVFTGSIVGEAIIAVLLFVVARGLMRGSSGMRLFVAIVECLTMALAFYILIAYQAGGYVFRGVFSLFVGVFVLWALYGNDESNEYFGADEKDHMAKTPTTVWTPKSSPPN